MRIILGLVVCCMALPLVQSADESPSTHADAVTLGARVAALEARVAELEAKSAPKAAPNTAGEPA